MESILIALASGFSLIKGSKSNFLPLIVTKKQE